MLKLLGSIFIIASCTALGLKIIIKKRNTQKALDELSDTLVEIARSIDFQLEPLPKIITTLCQGRFTEENSFINRLAQKTETNQNIPLSTLWNDALSAFSQDNDLPSEAKNLMIALGEDLGKMDAEIEKNRLISAKNHLSELSNEMESNNKKTEKMIRSLAVILGIFIVILFL